MSNSTPSAVTRYRPAILVLTGAAAAYTAYLVYNTLSAAPGDGLHRSNAIRRPNSQRRPSRTTRIISRLERDVPVVGDYTLLGLTVPLDPRNLIPPDDLRQAVVHSAPDATEDIIEVETARLYDIFLDRLLVVAFPNRPLAPAEVEAVNRWVGGRLPSSATVSRAVERHTQRLIDERPADTDGAESVAATDLSWNSDEDPDDDAIDPDGQTLQRTLYHIAEERARQEGVIHRGITCNACDEKPIRGTRWHCANCADFDLCSTCEATNSHTRTHIFYKIRVPAPYLSLAKQEPLYPGKPHMMSHSVNSALKKRLGSETKMEIEEIEALWDQFTCLANTEWESDPNKVGWALDRRAFNRAFVPRYNGFVAAPNLIYDRIFTYYDSDKNGLIGFEEWIKGIDGMHTTDAKIKARIVFNGYDIDGDGYISRKDVLRVFRAYYAIEKEATRNFVAELTEELSVRNALDTVRSSQPLGSAFPPNSLPSPYSNDANLAQKQDASFDDTTPVVLDNDFELTNRRSVIKASEPSRLISGTISKDDEERLLEDRWARRQFYIDEEEGLTRPEGANASDDDSVASGNDDERETVHSGPPGSGDRNRQPISRRASRVHFQDEINHETWCQQSTSKKPTKEQWGGYEIPELEKDLGTEVLYQITQQAFNELLDPLFRAREDMAMDAQTLRSERRKHAAAIEKLLEQPKGWGIYNRIVYRVGIFRFAKCVVANFCAYMSTADRLHGLEAGSEEDKETSIQEAIDHVQTEILVTIEPRSDDFKPTDIAEWNAELLKKQLHEEIKVATLRLLVPVEESSPDNLPSSPAPQTVSQPVVRDPTMPQFRPNSTADIEPDTTADVASSESESDTSEDLEDMTDDEGRIRIGPQGPFFVTARLNPNTSPSPEESQAEQLTTPATPPQTEPPFDSSASVPTTPPEPAPSPQDPSSSPLSINTFTNTPWLQTLTLHPPSESTRTPTLTYTRIHTTHTTNLYAISPTPDPLSAVVSNIRTLAKQNQNQPQTQTQTQTSTSSLYLPFLASLEAVDKEIRERRGGGRLGFDEFEKAVGEQGGRLRFLEGWMEWVSL